MIEIILLLIVCFLIFLRNLYIRANKIYLQETSIIILPTIYIISYLNTSLKVHLPSPWLDPNYNTENYKLWVESNIYSTIVFAVVVHLFFYYQQKCNSKFTLNQYLFLFQKTRKFPVVLPWKRIVWFLK